MEEFCYKITGRKIEENMLYLTLSCIILKNGPTYSKNLVHAGRFLKFLWIFFNIMHDRFNTSKRDICFFGLASARSYKIGVVGKNWLVGNAVFPETALRIFLIFCIKLGDYKGRKVTEPCFWRKFLIWRCLQKRLQISPKSETLIFCWLVGWLVTQFSQKRL